MVRSMLALAALALVAPVYANCNPVIDALERSLKQERIAQFDVDSPEQPLTGRPMMVKIGKRIWVDAGGSGYDQSTDTGSNPILNALKRDAAKGTAKCDPVGSASYRGQAVDKYRIDGSVGSSITGRMIMWVGTPGGLPLFHELEKIGPGGFAWVYGDAVKEPRK